MYRSIARVAQYKSLNNSQSRKLVMYEKITIKGALK